MRSGAFVAGATSTTARPAFSAENEPARPPATRSPSFLTTPLFVHALIVCTAEQDHRSAASLRLDRTSILDPRE